MTTAVRAATVEDVALAAGVSRQTVSRVLHDHPSVAADTRRRVREAMVELRWAPDPAAQALGRRSTAGPARAARPERPTGAAAVALLRAAGYRVVEVPASASAEVVAALLVAEPGPGAVVVTV